MSDRFSLDYPLSPLSTPSPWRKKIAIKCQNTTRAKNVNTVDPDLTANNLDLQFLPSRPLILNETPNHMGAMIKQ